MSFRGFAFSRAAPLLTFSDGSLGLLALHGISSVLAGLIRSLCRLKVSASFSANSCLLALVAPAVKIPLILLSAISRSISARFVFSVGETYWSVRTLTSFLWFRLFIRHVAKLSFCAWLQP